MLQAHFELLQRASVRLSPLPKRSGTNTENCYESPTSDWPVLKYPQVAGFHLPGDSLPRVMGQITQSLVLSLELNETRRYQRALRSATGPVLISLRPTLPSFTRARHG